MQPICIETLDRCDGFALPELGAQEHHLLPSCHKVFPCCGRVSRARNAEILESIGDEVCGNMPPSVPRRIPCRLSQ